MKTMSSNLHLNLNFSRKSSIKDSANTGAVTPGGYITPSDQCTQFQFQTPSILSKRGDSISSYYSDYNVNPNNPNNPDQPPLSKCDSISSISSSVYNQSGDSSPVNLNNYEFTPQFDESLMNVYYSYANRPNITPFNINFPPSGIVSKISRQLYHLLHHDSSIQLEKTLKKNEELMAESNQSLCLSLIRKRLLELCNSGASDNSNGFSISRSNSISSMGTSYPLQFQAHSQPQSQPQIPNRPSWLHQNPMFSATRLSSTDSLVDSVQFSATPTTPSASQQHPQLYHLSSSMSSSNNNNNDSMMITPPQSAASYSSSINQHHNHHPKLSLQSPLDQFTFETTKPLQSPFDETRFQFDSSHDNNSGNSSLLPNPKASIGQQHQPMRANSVNSVNSMASAIAVAGNGIMDLELDPLYNVTAQRKRDSLKLKRNMK